MSHDSSAIQIRDPFIVVDEGRYWLFGSTDANIWTGPGHGLSNDQNLWMVLGGVT